MSISNLLYCVGDREMQISIQLDLNWTKSGAICGYNRHINTQDSQKHFNESASLNPHKFHVINSTNSYREETQLERKVRYFIKCGYAYRLQELRAIGTTTCHEFTNELYLHNRGTAAFAENLAVKLPIFHIFMALETLEISKNFPVSIASVSSRFPFASPRKVSTLFFDVVIWRRNEDKYSVR